jgi:hypothetical protein
MGRYGTSRNLHILPQYDDRLNINTIKKSISIYLALETGNTSGLVLVVAGAEGGAARGREQPGPGRRTEPARPPRKYRRSHSPQTDTGIQRVHIPPS